MKLPINKIICDDYSIVKKWPAGCVNAIVTDPPYKFETWGGGFCDIREYLRKGVESIGVKKDLDLYSDGSTLTMFSKATIKVNLFIFCNKAQILDILLFVKKHKYCFALLPFCKTAPLPCSNRQWLPDREWGIHVFNRLPVMGELSTKRGFFINSNYQDRKIPHPTPKPVPLMCRIIRNISNPDDIILDPFCGSGTTCVAAKMLGRRYIGIDNKEKSCKLARQRLEGVKPNLFETMGRKKVKRESFGLIKDKDKKCYQRTYQSKGEKDENQS